MPNWLDYLNPNNAEKNRKIAEDIKNGVVPPNTTNQSVNTESNSTGSSNNYNPTENRFTAVNPDNAQNNLDWINSQQAQTSQSSQNAQNEAQQALAVKQQKEAREAQEAQQAEAARQEREAQEAQEAREVYQRQVEQRNQDRETREAQEAGIRQERETREAKEVAVRQESEVREAQEATETQQAIDARESEIVKQREREAQERDIIWTDEDRSIEKEIIEKKGDNTFLLNPDGQEMILPEFLPETGYAGVELPKELIAGTFAQMVYNDGSGPFNLMPRGWVKSDYNKETWDGYYAEVFYNVNSKELIISHKGSDLTSFKDWVGNWDSIKNERNHFQAEHGLAVHDYVAERIPEDYQIIHTGHSLGGHIAEVVANNRASTAYSFDPLYSGLNDSYEGIWRYAPTNGAYMISSGKQNISPHFLWVHPLDALLKRLEKQIINDVTDHINPIADNIFSKSELLKGLFPG